MPQSAKPPVRTIPTDSTTPRWLLVGPGAPVAEPLVELLAASSRPPALVAAALGDEVGTDFEWRGESEVVASLDRVEAEAFDGLILAVPTGTRRLPEAKRVLRLPGAGREGRMVLAGFGPNAALGEAIRLPEPAATVVARVVAALGAEVRGIEAVVLEGASAEGRPGMDELRDQTVDLLNFREPRAEVFARRLAFDTLPRTAEADAALVADLEALLPGVQVGVARTFIPAFVGLQIALRVVVEGEVRGWVRRLEASEHLLVDELPGLARAIDEGRILVTPPREVGGILRLWVAADDTVVGGAQPAAELLRGW